MNEVKCGTFIFKVSMGGRLFKLVHDTAWSERENDDVNVRWGRRH